MSIKNIVFDIGNVMVRWDPLWITAQVFPHREDKENLAQQLFKSQTWFDLNLGKITEQELQQIYHQTLNIPLIELGRLMQVVKESLTPLAGSFELLTQLHESNISLYALTDNTHEIMSYLRKKYDFWQLFKGVVVSAEVGSLKPSAAIFQHLLDSYQLNPAETVFIDDHAPNVEGARAVNMTAIQFHNSSQCKNELRQLQINF